MFEKILVCLDGSELAEQILPYAAAQAKCFQSEMVLLHVIPGGYITAPGIPGASGGPVRTPGALEQLEKEEEEAGKYLEQVAETLQEQGINVSTEIFQGDPGASIISYAGENDIGLIAIATHGRSGLGRVIMGSVADYVTKNSGLPVLLIRCC